MKEGSTVTATDTAVRVLQLADAPPIPGLRFRRYRGPEDHPALVTIYNRKSEADGDTEVATVERMDVDYADLTNSDPYRDVIVAEVDEHAVAYSRVEWLDETDGGRAYICFGFVDPAWRRRGIGRAMLRENERRLREIAAEHSHDRPRWLASWGSDRDVSNTHLLLSEDYVAVRHFYGMVRPDLEDIDIPPLPDGLEIRPVAPEDLRKLFDADVEAFMDHWGPMDGSDASFRRWVNAPDFDPTLHVVAWDGDEIAGAIINLIDRAENERRGYQRGWLDSVFTRRRWRRRGLARALIGRSFALLKERGMTSAQLGVDAENPNEALKLYKDAGFEIHTSATAYRKAFDPVVGREW